MEDATSTFGLLERVQQGDKQALSDLFQKNIRRLAVLVHYKMSPDLRRFADVDDVVQETLLEAYRDIDQFNYRKPGSFLSWLARIADHVIVDLARSQGRQKRAAELVRFKSESNPLGPDPAVSSTPSRILAEKENVALLIAKLDRLPDNYREVILLAKVEGLTTQELAGRLGQSRES
ncbi:MAG TPA: sigma-70 family RNA polymerase sigma factor, partial [Blastocatellia bacterium]|nr:sigma-70 family RNA polymerase sigma factor [Blastocatellia bacterium]